MSDDRLSDDANANGEHPYLDRKPYRPSSGTPTKFDLADEVEKFLAEYCARFGIKPKGDKKTGESRGRRGDDNL